MYFFFRLHEFSDGRFFFYNTESTVVRREQKKKELIQNIDRKTRLRIDFIGRSRISSDEKSNCQHFETTVRPYIFFLLLYIQVAVHKHREPSFKIVQIENRVRLHYHCNVCRVRERKNTQSPLRTNRFWSKNKKIYIYLVREEGGSIYLFSCVQFCQCPKRTAADDEHA